MKSASFKRFFRNINLIHKETGKNRVILFFDMILCALTRGIGYLDYYTFGFATTKGKKRDTFVTMNDNVAYSSRCNKKEAIAYFDQKLLFNKAFDKYLKRDWCNLNDGYEAFETFAQGKTYFFGKRSDSFGGLGVEKVQINKDLHELYRELLNDGFELAEEAIVQHETMNQLCALSVNTIRIVTILDDRDVAHFIYALIRIGNGKNDVDNVTSGGMYTLLSKDGKITHPCFCDKTVSYYNEHPYNHFPFIGFEVPYFKEAVAMCQEAAHVIKDMRYVGWDVAITPTGPVLVEGNNIPGYDMPQNHAFHDDGCGMKADFEAAMKYVR